MICYKNRKKLYFLTFKLTENDFFKCVVKMVTVFGGQVFRRWVSFADLKADSAGALWSLQTFEVKDRIMGRASWVKSLGGAIFSYWNKALAQYSKLSGRKK
jgi:hypothetical protein